MNDSRRLLWVHVLHLLCDGVVATLLTLYLWKSSTLQVALTFRFLELLAMPVAIFVVGFIVDRFSAKTGFMIGIALLLAQLVTVLIVAKSFQDWMLLLSLLGGSSAIFRFLSLNALTQSVVSPTNQSNFFAQMSVRSRILSVLFPLVSGLLIARFGYALLFAVAVGLSIALLFLLPRAVRGEGANVYRPFHLFFSPWTRVRRQMFFIHMLWGIEFALTMTMVPVISTMLLHGELGWGFFTASVACISALFALYLGKTSHHLAKQSSIGIFAFLMATTALFFATNTSFLAYAVFILVLSFWQVVQGVVIRPRLNALMKSSDETHVLQTEYQQHVEVAFWSGRIAMMGVMVLIGEQLTSFVLIGFLFAFLSLIPLYEAQKNVLFDK